MLSVSAGSVSYGAHHRGGQEHAGELHRPDPDRTLTGRQPQRPAQVVCARRTLQNSVRLHQETHHQHEVFTQYMSVIQGSAKNKTSVSVGAVLMNDNGSCFQGEGSRSEGV